MKVSAIYFSPTGGSKKSAGSLAAALSGGSHAEIDLTPADATAVSHSFGPDDFVVFSVPCYKGRVPIIAVQRMAGIRGNQTPCIVSVTYGNRDYDDALLELHDLAAEKGFLVQGAAALVGRHTYGEIQVGRPDEKDAAENRRFVEELRAARHNDFSKAVTLHIKGQTPYRGEGSGGKFHPLTSDACTQCGLCVAECPTHAIADDCRTIDAAKCLSCFRCLRLCPVGAKNMDSEPYLSFARDFSQKLAARRENEYIL